ncbi:MAG: fibronectin type III domain-containing protein [Saccharospirillum sp.]
MLATVLLSFGLAGCDMALMGLGGSSGSSEGSVSLYWSPPMERINGEELDPREDISGYIIRYRHPSENRFTSVFVANDGVESYHLDRIKDPSQVIFQIAAVDKNGIYSDFVTAAR